MKAVPRSIEKEIIEEKKKALPEVTLILPAYNEAGIITESLNTLCNYMRTLDHKYQWDILLINDGSNDDTGKLADSYASKVRNIKVHHHKVNRNLGGALRTGFALAQGDYVLVLDMDLSYAPEHIERLLDEIIDKDAEIVIASPYMKGGKCTKIPFFRLMLSKSINRIMRYTSGINIHTFTGMARVYKREFLDTLNLKSSTYSINPEIIHKAVILRAQIIEIPAHLDWSFQKKKNRTSGIRIYKGILLGLMSSFIFRPYGLFMMVGFILLILSLYVIGWIFYHVSMVYPEIQVSSDLINDRFTEAVKFVYETRPHAFFVGGFTFVIAIQFLGLGFISLQKKRYFDELFHLNSSVLKQTKEMNDKV